MIRLLNDLRKRWKRQEKPLQQVVNIVRRLPNGHIAFGPGDDAPTIDPGKVCFCGKCPRCRFADAMINGLWERFPKFKEWTLDQPPVFWLNYRAHYQAIADGILALLEGYSSGEHYEIWNERDKLSVPARREWTSSRK